MGSNTLAYATALLAALVAVVERFGSAPIPAAQGSSAPFAGQPVMTAVRTSALATTHVAARKADDRFRPRGRRR